MNEKKALLVAVIFHLLILFIPQWSEIHEKTIEVFNREDLEGRKPVVQTSKAIEEFKSDKKARFSGEFHQRVEKESQSPLKGPFEQGAVARSLPEVFTKDGEGSPQSEKSSGILSLGKSPHALPKDIPYGNETVLNTDKVKYASFLNRVADEIYHSWVDFAEEAIDLYKRQSKKVDPNLYITRLKVTMNAEGEVKIIQLVQSSGIRELDEAPKKAFWEVETFPHPPQQLIEEDGFVRLTYEFQFECKNSFFNIIPSKI